MNVDQLTGIQRVFGIGAVTLIDYVLLGNGCYEPRFIGVAPLDAPEDAERWRISVLYYSQTTWQVEKIRNIEKQHRWTDRGSLV